MEFGCVQSRYTQSDAGTLSGLFEPTVTGMLIVRYYQKGKITADSGRNRLLQPAYFLLVGGAVGFTLGE